MKSMHLSLLLAVLYMVPGMAASAIIKADTRKMVPAISEADMRSKRAASLGSKVICGVSLLSAAGCGYGGYRSLKKCRAFHAQLKKDPTNRKLLLRRNFFAILFIAAVLGAFGSLAEAAYACSQWQAIMGPDAPAKPIDPERLIARNVFAGTPDNQAHERVIAGLLRGENESRLSPEMQRLIEIQRGYQVADKEYYTRRVALLGTYNVKTLLALRQEECELNEIVRNVRSASGEGLSGERAVSAEFAARIDKERSQILANKSRFEATEECRAFMALEQQHKADLDQRNEYHRMFIESLVGAAPGNTEIRAGMVGSATEN